MIARAAVLVLCFASSGCWTSLKVSRVRPESRCKVEGVRYSLPIPVLELRRATDGSIEVAVRYLPDASRTYAIHNSSFLAAHDLQVEVRKGLLESVTWDVDSAGVASSLIEGGGEVGVELLKRETKREEAAEAARKEERDAIAQIEKQVVEKRTSLAVALARLQAMRSNGASAEDLRKQMIEVAAKEEELRQVEAQLATRLANLAGRPENSLEKITDQEKADNGSIHDEAAPSLHAKSDPKPKMKPELLLFHIRNDERDDVVLEELQIADLPNAPPAAPPSPPLEIKAKDGLPIVVPSPTAVRDAAVDVERAERLMEAARCSGTPSQRGAAAAALESARFRLDQARLPVFHVVSNLAPKGVGLQLDDADDLVSVERVALNEWRLQMLPPLPDGPLDIAFVVLFDGARQQEKLRVRYEPQ